MELNPGNSGSFPADTYTIHRWRQVGMHDPSKKKRKKSKDVIFVRNVDGHVN